MVDAFWRLVKAAHSFCRKVHMPAGRHTHRGSAHNFRVFVRVRDGSIACGLQVKRFLPSLVYCKHLQGNMLTHLWFES